MNYTVILSGGVGSRMGLDMPKQYYKVADKPVIGYVLDTIEKHDKIDGYIVVAAEAWQPVVVELIGNGDKFLGFAMPGENRQLSIYSGLMALKNVAKEDDLVLIQDAARANTSYDLIRRCLEITDDEDGAMPVLSMKDTVYLSRDGKKVDELLKREQIFAGQAPESFRYGKYVRANEALLPDTILAINGSTEPAVKAGMQIALIDGEESNFKITTMEDLKRFERIVSER